MGRRRSSGHWWLAARKRCLSPLLLSVTKCHRVGNVCVYTGAHTCAQGLQRSEVNLCWCFPRSHLSFPSLFSCMCVHVWYACVMCRRVSAYMFRWCACVCMCFCICMRGWVSKIDLRNLAQLLSTRVIEAWALN